MANHFENPLAIRPMPLRTGGRTMPEVRRIIAHITGTSTYINAYMRKLPPLVHLRRAFQTGNFSTYLVDPWGIICQVCPETMRTQAQGWGTDGRRRVTAKVQAGHVPNWWYNVHAEYLRALHLAEKGPGWQPVVPGHISPLDYLGPTEASPNNGTISIEFIQWQPDAVLEQVRRRAPATVPRNYRLTVQQYNAGARLIDDICKRHGLPKTRFRVLGHEDTDPWGRGKDDSGGWDPGAHRITAPPRFCWDCMLRYDPQSCKVPIVIPVEKPTWAVI